MSTFSSSKWVAPARGAHGWFNWRWTLLTAVSLGWMAAASSPAHGAEVDQAVNGLEAYHLGQDATSLRDIETLVGKATASSADSGLREPLAERLAAVLKTDASEEAKQFVCRQLALIGTAEQVPALADLLKKSGYTDMALYALGAIQDASVNPALVASLDSLKAGARIGVVDTLGFRRAAEAVEPLGKLLSSTEPGTAQAAAAALGRIGGPTAVHLLQEALPGLSGAEHFSAAEGLLKCADAFLGSGQADEAGPIYAALFSPNEPVTIRSAALRGLVRTGPGSGHFALQALRENDPKIVRAAIGCIQAVPGAAATREFAAALPELPEPAQVTLLNALANRGDAAALPAVTALARSPVLTSRVAALEAMGRLGDRDSVELLVAAAAEPAPIGPAARESLGTMRAAGVDTTLAEQIAQARSTLQVQLIPILTKRGAVEAVPTLMTLAGGEDENSAVEALKALGELGDTKNLPFLLRELVETGRTSVREAGEEAIVGVARRSTAPDQAARAVLAAYREQTQVPVRASLLRILSGIGQNSCLEAVTRACSDTDPAVQEAGVRALSDWPNEAALPALMTVFEGAPNRLQSTLALRGLVRLAALAANQQPPKPTLAIYERIRGKVSGPDEVRLFLSGLGEVADPKALGFIEPFFSDEATREEASAASLKVATAIAARDPEAARTASQKVIAASRSAAQRQQAKELLGKLSQNEGFITQWEAAGPFVLAGKSAADLFDTVFDPERGKGDQATWKRISLTESPGTAPVVDLLTLFGGSDRVAYLKTWVHSDQVQSAQLELGSDDGVKAWLNGTVVHANNVDRGLAPGQDKVPVTLKAGWNELLLKITQGGGGWAACARLRGRDGESLRGLRVDPEHKGAP